MSEVRVAILGIGWAGSKHVEAIRELGEGAVVDEQGLLIRQAIENLNHHRVEGVVRRGIDGVLDRAMIGSARASHRRRRRRERAAGKGARSDLAGEGEAEVDAQFAQRKYYGCYRSRSE